ncbi:hypothetical protein [Legionella hackeliae]|uniref:Uncharacterized protein n=1 Tax=Legionella hackeliae TaxID=449 RepID=A0A0A8UWV8_LEGHA|nr:hypothetical protein [Legionella hackeliae]KTD12605.1 effector protein B, substrate of the Dot/Icm secretion system [Legionella hackeliae]CEK12021.1 protein of unknown function [Legionella hackeliae]STX48804.1 LepB protein [Legionella hackeliae]
MAPRAFSQLCKKANFSIFNDTLTIYVKPNGEYEERLILDHKIGGFRSVQEPCYYISERDKYTTERRLMDELGVIQWVKLEHDGHHLLHQDAFDREGRHSHAKFKKVIDEPFLIEIVEVLKRSGYISHEEETQFIDNFNLANRLDVDGYFTEQLNKAKKLQKDLETKSTLNPNKYEKAVRAAKDLCTTLEAEYVKFDDAERSSTSAEEFKKNALAAIEAAQSELKHHRGWKEVFYNVGLAVSMLVIPYIAVGLYNVAQKKDFMFFKVETESSSELKAFEAELFPSMKKR